MPRGKAQNPRPQFKTVPIWKRVQAHIEAHPDASNQDISDALMLDMGQVYSAKTQINKQASKSGEQVSEGSPLFSIHLKDVLVVKKMGITKVEQIIKLLKAIKDE